MCRNGHRASVPGERASCGGECVRVCVCVRACAYVGGGVGACGRRWVLGACECAGAGAHPYVWTDDISTVVRHENRHSGTTILGFQTTLSGIGMVRNSGPLLSSRKGEVLKGKKKKKEP